MIRRLLRTWSARYLAHHGNQVRKERERERIRARARQMCEAMGRPIPEALR